MKSLSHVLMIVYWITVGACTFLFSQKPVIIDERQDSSVITQVIEIDKVWAGHPVGFCLLTSLYWMLITALCLSIINMM